MRTCLPANRSRNWHQEIDAPLAAKRTNAPESGAVRSAGNRIITVKYTIAKKAANVVLLAGSLPLPKRPKELLDETSGRIRPTRGVDEQGLNENSSLHIR